MPLQLLDLIFTARRYASAVLAVAHFNLPICIWRSHSEWRHPNFAEIFGIRKRVRGLSCGVACV